MQNETVLVIDDNETSCEALRGFLASEGFNADCCMSGLTALDRARKGSYTTFLINYRMPVMKGDDVTRLLRRSHPNAFIIGFSVAPKYNAFKNAGADIFVNKEDLVRTIIPLIKTRNNTR